MKTKIIGLYNLDNMSEALVSADDLRGLVTAVWSQDEKPKIKEKNGWIFLYAGSGKAEDIKQALLKGWDQEFVDDIFRSELRVFVVWASCGRSNGHCFVLAENLAEAKSIARSSSWLDDGRVDSAQTYDQYVEDDMGSKEDDKDHLDKLNEKGDWVEIDWGT